MDAGRDDADMSEDCPGYAVIGGVHSWRVEPGRRIYLDLPLTGRQVLALARNPAILRACSAQGWVDVAWLDARIADAATVGDSMGTRH